MSLETIQELLSKHKLVEGMIQRQEMPRYDLVGSLVQKQHLAELRSVLSRLKTVEIVEILDTLPAEDLFLVWEQINEELLDDILIEVSDATRDTLATRSSYLGSACVVNAFELAQGRLNQTTIESVEDLEGIKPIWVDLVGATKGDRRKIGQYFGLELPDPEDLTDIESSARFFVEENGEIHLHSDFLLDREGESRNVSVAFILFQNILFSLRKEELPAFRLQRLRARIPDSSVSDSINILLDLYAADVEYSADSLEEVYAALAKVSKQVLKRTITDEEAAVTLAAIAEEEDLNGRIRRNVMDTRRALTFLTRRKLLSLPQFEDAQQILRDIKSLDGHTAFLFEKINFLMDAIDGCININQNRVIYRLTVLSVIFMPLNVIAGIGGMSEFSMMTKNIPWPVSYALFTVGMLIVAAITYVILRLFERRQRPK